MKELTPDDVAPILSHILDYPYKQHETATRIYTRFANAILAKYGNAPDERVIIERERKAWDVAVERWHQMFITPPQCIEHMNIERERFYPLPKAEPAPVLTDEDVREMVANSRFVWNDVLVRNIERAVLAKLAEQKP